MKDKIKEAIETYNKYAKIYAQYTSEKLLQFQLNKFISMLPKKAKIIDVGCGAGRDVKYFKEEGLDVLGIDISEGLLKEAKKNVKGEFLNMDILDLKLDKESFDGVWCMATLADIEKKNSLKAINQFNKILKKKGILYVAVKEGEGEKIINKEKYENSPRFYCFYKQEELEDLLKKANFQIIESAVSDDAGTQWVEIFARKSEL